MARQYICVARPHSRHVLKSSVVDSEPIRQLATEMPAIRPIVNIDWSGA